MRLKKITAIFLAAALIFSVPVLPVGAENINKLEVGVVAETATPVSVSPTIYNSDENVTVKISVDKNTGINYLRFVVHFNSEALEYIDYDQHYLFGTPDDSIESVQVKSSYIIFSVISSNAFQNTGDLLTVNFKTKSDYCGNVEIYTELVQNREANCKNGSEYVSFVAGSDSFVLHNLDSEAGVVTAPTCTEEGFTTYQCSTCNEAVVGNIISATGHSPATAVEENRVEPDCLNKGSYDSVVYCSVCDAELSREEGSIDALGHDLKSTDAKAPTCTEIGWEAYVTCQRQGCDYTTYVEIPANGHSPAAAVEENRVEPDCINTGSYDSVIYCSVCDAELSREKVTIDALGHDLKHTDAKAPTCTEIGWNAYDTCQRAGCGYTTYEEIAALGHDLKHTDAKAPTCTEIGWNAYDTCQRAGCGYTTYEEIPALGHDLKHTDAKAPTCTEIGWNAYDTCQRTGCGYTTYEEIPAHGHSPAAAVEENRVEPDCLNTGSYDSVIYCSICDIELSREKVTIEALGHDLKHTCGQDATCTEIGWESYETCQRAGCGYTTYKEIPAKGHSYGEVTVVEPEYKVEGYSIHTCKICDHVEKFDITPALTYLLGDVDADEEITSDDAIHLLYHTFLPDEYAINQKADFNGDGIVDSDDAVYLLYHTMLPEQYPLNK